MKQKTIMRTVEVETASNQLWFCTASEKLAGECGADEQLTRDGSRICLNGEGFLAALAADHERLLDEGD